MNRLLKLLAGLAAGAAAMYYLDPRTGRRRRAETRDRITTASHDTARRIRGQSRRAIGRIQGAVARTRSRLVPGPVDDELLRDRIRARLGHVVGHPSTIQVQVAQGQVQLAGAFPKAAARRIARAAARVPGVRSVDDRLLQRQD